MATATEPVRWYFDFISPFAYLQWCRLRGESIRFESRPLLFAGLLKHWGHKGPAEIPAKRRFTYRHVQWLAQRHGYPLRFPPAHPFNPLAALRLAVALEARPEPIDAIFRYLWEYGRDPADPVAWQALRAQLGPGAGDGRTDAAQVKAQLAANGEQALACGVFGVPTIAIGEALFWGFDATDMALEYLADPARRAAGEWDRLDGLPAAAVRREV
jgi:2-hydroxychromene-2-carboxylate isomerase